MIDLNNINYFPSKFLTSRDKSKTLFEESTYKYFDHFVSSGWEYVIAPKYPNCKQIVLPNEFFPKEQIVRIKQTTEPNTYTDTEQHSLVLVTMFLNETEQQLNTFFEYYEKQGVTKFFMFYNGRLEEKKNSLPQRKTVLYIEWNFGYWIYDQTPNAIKKRLHHAQIGAINTGVYKYSHIGKYCIVCDTDEYMYCSNQTLKEYLLANNINVPLKISNHFCYIENKNLYYNTKRKDIEKNPLTKIIYPTSRFIENPKKVINVHTSFDSIECKDIIMFHNKNEILENCNQIITF